MKTWRAGRFLIDLSTPRVMGIVNVTPDSFFDGGAADTASAACARCDQLVGEGADILDLGGESTRPGSGRVDARTELARLLPVVRHAVTLGVPVSVDTYKPEVMWAVLDAGADIINDIDGMRDARSVDAVRAGSCGICLMHMQGRPDAMHGLPAHADVIMDVRRFFAAQLAALGEAGIDPERVVLDPGVGFGKSVANNFSLLTGQQALLELGRPLLVGWSRKSSLGAVTGREVHQRLPASLAAAMAAIIRGASILRVHDVTETVDVLTVFRHAGLTSTVDTPS